MQALTNDIFLIVNLFSQTQTNLCADLFSNPNQVYFQFLVGDQVSTKCETFQIVKTDCLQLGYFTFKHKYLVLSLNDKHSFFKTGNTNEIEELFSAPGTTNDLKLN